MRPTLRSLLCAVAVVLGLGALAPAATGSGTGTLAGTVLDAAGAPFDTAEVLLTQDCGEEFCGSYHVVDAAGHYEIGGLSPGMDYCARFYNGSDEQTFCFTATDGVLVHDVTLARQAATATVSGTVTDAGEAPVAGARVWFSGTYDAATDVAGHYEISLPPGEHAVDVWLPTALPMVRAGVVTVSPGAAETFDIRLPAENRLPQGTITWSRGRDGRLVVGGRASDESGVLKIRVAVLDRTTGKWLRGNGRWGAYTKLRAHIARSKAPTTRWRFSRKLPRGSYGVSLIVIDDQRLRNPVPRPWRPIRVKR